MPKNSGKPGDCEQDMSSFEDKWNDATQKARQAEEPIPEVPLGFATRVVALSRETAEPVITWLASFERYIFKTAAAVGLAVVITSGFVVKDYLTTPSIVPAVENEVVEQFILL